MARNFFLIVLIFEELQLISLLELFYYLKHIMFAEFIIARQVEYMKSKLSPH
jgi:hypothetical protein